MISWDFEKLRGSSLLASRYSLHKNWDVLHSETL